MLNDELKCLIEGWQKQAECIARIPAVSKETLVRRWTLLYCIRGVEYLLANQSKRKNANPS